MQKDVLHFLKRINMPMAFVSLYLGRLLYSGTPNYAECFTLFSLVSLYGFRLWLDFNKKPDPTDDMKKELDQVKQALNIIKVAHGKPAERTPFKF
jgi:hypothetical protein